MVSAGTLKAAAAVASPHAMPPRTKRTAVQAAVTPRAKATPAVPPSIRKSRLSARAAFAEEGIRQQRATGTDVDSSGEVAAAHLIAADPKFTPLVAEHGPISLGAIKRSPSAFAALLKAIVFQQLAGKVATSIHERALKAIKSDPPTPAAVLATSHADLRGAGLSDRKASYIVGLAEHFSDGRLSDELLQTASDEELVRALMAVKGIGPSTCDNFMIFQLCRPDVLPAANLCVQKGVNKFFGLGGDQKLSPAELECLSRAWSPYRSYASYYMWLHAKSAK